MAVAALADAVEAMLRPIDEALRTSASLDFVVERISGSGFLLGGLAVRNGCGDRLNDWQDQRERVGIVNAVEILNVTGSGRRLGRNRINAGLLAGPASNECGEATNFVTVGAAGLIQADQPRADTAGLTNLDDAVAELGKINPAGMVWDYLGETARVPTVRATGHDSDSDCLRWRGSGLGLFAQRGAQFLQLGKARLGDVPKAEFLHRRTRQASGKSQFADFCASHLGESGANSVNVESLVHMWIVAPYMDRTQAPRVP